MNDRRSFYRYNSTIKFSKGETIFLQYEVPNYVYCIKSGVVEESNITHEGNRQSISLYIVGDILPKGWAFSRSSKTLFDYFAHTDCELYIIEKGVFLQQLSENIDFSNKILNQSIRSLLSACLHIDLLGKTKADMKLLYAFRLFCSLYGTNLKNDLIKIQIPFTQQDISEFVGMTRETTNIELNKLKAAKVITFRRKYYTVNTILLGKMMDDECDLGMLNDMLHLDTQLINNCK